MYAVNIASSQFKGLSLVKQHRMVVAAIDGDIKVAALSNLLSRQFSYISLFCIVSAVCTWHSNKDRSSSLNIIISLERRKKKRRTYRANEPTRTKLLGSTDFYYYTQDSARYDKEYLNLFIFILLVLIDHDLPVYLPWITKNSRLDDPSFLKRLLLSRDQCNHRS